MWSQRGNTEKKNKEPAELASSPSSSWSNWSRCKKCKVFMFMSFQVVISSVKIFVFCFVATRKFFGLFHKERGAVVGFIVFLGNNSFNTLHEKKTQKNETKPKIVRFCISLYILFKEI